MKRYWTRTVEGKEMKWTTVEVDMPRPWVEITKEEFDNNDIKVNKKWWRK